MRTAVIFVATLATAICLVYLPCAILLRVTSDKFTRAGVVVVTVAMPTIAWMICRGIGRANVRGGVAPLHPLAVLVGIWVAGPIEVLGRELLSGGRGISVPSEIGDVIVGLPILALSYATYTGSLPGLILTSIVLWFSILVEAGRLTWRLSRRGPLRHP